MEKEVEKLATGFFKNLQDLYEKNGKKLDQVVILLEKNEEIKKQIEDIKETQKNISGEEAKIDKGCLFIPGIGVICF